MLLSLSGERSSGDAWILSDAEQVDHGPFEWVIITAPSHQTSALVPNGFAHLNSIRAARMTGCYSVMLGFDTLPKLNWDIAKPRGSLIGWIAVNSLKPGRETAPSILIQTTNEWAEHHIDENVQEMEDLIVKEFSCLSGVSAADIKHRRTHRWRYADTALSAKAEEGFLLDDRLKIGVCGDWCIEGRVESAFISADKLCDSIIKSLSV